ncbi:hypothetical protein TFLX_05645 [Thermoflexales bacterium]|nr:hypothetical protein TFLX_05645 [Thermoflexales bacterium]
MSNLFQLLGGYFNEDWDLEADDDRGIVEFFMKQEPRETIQQTLNELQTLLGQKKSEDELNKIVFGELHCRYNPTADGLTTSQWLASLANQIDSGLKQVSE